VSTIRVRSASRRRPLAGETLVFAGRLVSLDQHEARAIAERLGAVVVDDMSEETTLVVVGGAPPKGKAHGAVEATLRRARQRAEVAPDQIRLLDEDRFCDLAGVLSASALRQQFHPASDLLERYSHVREDHLRYMQTWGLIRPAHRTPGETYYGFPDLAVIREADAELAGGATFRTVLRALVEARSGQLAFDFRLEAQSAKVLELPRPEPPPMVALMDPPPRLEASSAEQYFVAASILDDGDPSNFDEAVAAYRRALEIDPYLVPALVNLANLHYAQDAIPEAQALYERAITLEPDLFEAHFNLGNIFHDLGRYPEAQGSYEASLSLNPTYANAHFYMAVTLEKRGLSQQARPHWRVYQQLAPNGEWLDLAKEFSD
jgi:Flp pilus assembly protein TadD